MRKRVLSLFAVIVVAVGGLSLSGCGLVAKKDADVAGRSTGAVAGAITLVSGTAASNGVSGDGTVKPSAGSAAAGSPAANWIQLDASKSSIGTTVAEVHGLMLYRFDKDKAKPSSSSCFDACAVAWPPVTIVAGVNV